MSHLVKVRFPVFFIFYSRLKPVKEDQSQQTGLFKGWGLKETGTKNNNNRHNEKNVVFFEH